MKTSSQPSFRRSRPAFHCRFHRRFGDRRTLTCVLWLIALAYVPTRDAHAGIPGLEFSRITDVSMRSATLVFGMSEPSEVSVLVYLDAQGLRPSTAHRVNVNPFRYEDTATRASQRNLGAVRLEQLSPNTAYFVRLVLTSESTRQSGTYPSSGMFSLHTAKKLDPLVNGALSLNDAIVHDLTPPEGTAAGSLAVLELEGALSALGSFLGDARPAESAFFDLNNLVDASSKTLLRPAAETPVILSHYNDSRNERVRGYRLPASHQGGRALLEPYSQTLELESGWTYFALEVEPESLAPEDVLVSVWNGTQQLWCYSPESGWQGGSAGGGTIPDALPLRYGCLIQHTTGGEAEVTGPRVLDPLPLIQGWNVATLSNVQALNIVTSLVPALNNQLRAVWCYDALTLAWHGWDATLAEMNDLVSIDAGAVCYLELSSATEWNPR